MKQLILLATIAMSFNVQADYHETYLSENEVRTMMNSDQKVCIFKPNAAADSKVYLGINKTIFNSLNDEMIWDYENVCEVSISVYDIEGDHGRVTDNLYTDGLMI